jgi:cytochrome c-type biogenesis protein CcmH/NrfG
VTDQLEGERDFLLRSLDDLEAERAAGAIDDQSYRALHDDYTARAAAVVRALRDGVDARPVAPRPSWVRRTVVISGLVAFAVAAGFALAFALGARLPGQTASGNTASSDTASSSDRQRARLIAAVKANPDDVPARMLLARYLESSDDLPGALKQYDTLIRADPTNAEAYAQAGRIVYLTAAQAPAAQAADLVDSARARLDKAIELDPGLPDARFFRAIILANEFGDFAGSQADLQRYLLAEPNGMFADQARQLLADVTNALESPTTSRP